MERNIANDLIVKIWGIQERVAAAEGELQAISRSLEALEFAIADTVLDEA